MNRHVALLAVAAGLLSGCASESQGTFTILDDGSGAMLCEAVMESYPPQCNGEFLTDWDWDAVSHQEASGVRWGEYVLTYVDEGDRIRVIEALPAR